MDYDRARHRAVINVLLSTILDRPSRLVRMAEVRCGRVFAGQAYAGLRQVPVDRIVGSLDRARDFDYNFNPLATITRARWERINCAFLRGIPLPPVLLDKVGNDYFVVDGHHRVSVARFHGAAYIDAEVSEYHYAAEKAA